MKFDHNWSHKDALSLLEHSYSVEQEEGGGSRLTFLADKIFDFTTYDDGMSEHFAHRAVEVCAAITEAMTYPYVKDREDYQWYLLMVNMPFFAGRLNWGTSIRGAWWEHKDQTLESCGLWVGHAQLDSVIFTHDAWVTFMRAVVEFSKLPIIIGEKS